MASTSLTFKLFGQDVSASKALKGVGRVSTGVAGGIAAAWAATNLVGLFKDSIKGASDLAETTSKVGVIFGAQAPQIQAFAASAATALGQSQQQAMDAAASFAIIGQGAGLAGQDVVDFSTQMTTLAGDLASFHNATPEEAITAIGAAMRGEMEPARRFGIMLDDNALRAEALRLGLIKTTKQALTPQQKALAAQAAILKQTKAAQGDFARTSGGLANQQRIAKAAFANVTAELGSALLPVLTDLAKFVTGSVMPAVQGMADFVRDNSTAVLAGAAAIGGLVVATRLWSVASQAWAAIQGVVTAAQWAWNAALSANPIGLVVIAIAALVAAVVLAYQKFDWFRAFIDAAWDGIQAAIGGVVEWFQDTAWPLIQTVIGYIVAYYRFLFAALKVVWTGIWNAIKAVVDWFAGTVWPRIKTVIGWIANYYGFLWNTMKTVWSGIFNAIAAVVNWFRDTAWPKIKAAIDLVSRGFGIMWTAVKTVWDDVWGKVSGVVTLLEGAATRIKSAFSGIWDGIKHAAQAALDVVRTAWNSTVGGKTLTIPSIPAIGTFPGFPGFSYDIPYLADGGIVRSPTLAMIGEAGPEAVVPLTRGRDYLGGGGETHVHVHLSGIVAGTKDDVARAVVASIRDASRRGTVSLAGLTG